jgi:hypothetical protein
LDWSPGTFFDLLLLHFKQGHKKVKKNIQLQKLHCGFPNGDILFTQSAKMFEVPWNFYLGFGIIRLAASATKHIDHRKADVHTVHLGLMSCM